MALVVICSPLRAPTPGGVEEHKVYARAAMRNSLLRGESPVATHLLYTQVLEDDIPAERAAGMIAAEGIIVRADLLAVYIDAGISDGMRSEITKACAAGVRVVFRTLKKPSEDLPFSRQAQAGSVSMEDFENDQKNQTREGRTTGGAAAPRAAADSASCAGGGTVVPLRRFKD